MLALLLPAGLAAPAAVLAADPEVISSVDFDDSTTGTWTQSGSPTLSFVDDGAGGQALSILRAQDYEGIQSPTGLLEHGVVYTLSMRARLPEGTAGSTDVRLVVKPNFTWVGNTTIDGSGWTTISGTYTLPDEVDPAASQVYVGSTNQAAPYTILVDDILITAPAAPPTDRHHQLGRLRRRHDRHLDPVRQPDPVVRRRRRRRPGAQHPAGPGLRGHPVADRPAPARRRVHALDAGPAARGHGRLDRRPARRQAQLHVGRQRHDRRLRLDDDQRHLHPARRGRPRPPARSTSAAPTRPRRTRSSSTTS